jgi:probable HAF family extracellular repeat protein
MALTAENIYHAFLWTQAGGMQDLGVLDTGTFNPGSVAYGINDKGVIVGGSNGKDGYNQAVLWKQGHIYTLKGIGPPDPSQESGPLSVAFAINYTGQITGARTGVCLDFSGRHPIARFAGRSGKRGHRHQRCRPGGWLLGGAGKLISVHSRRLFISDLYCGFF